MSRPAMTECVVVARRDGLVCSICESAIPVGRSYVIVLHPDGTPARKHLPACLEVVSEMMRAEMAAGNE